MDSENDDEVDGGNEKCVRERKRRRSGLGDQRSTTRRHGILGVPDEGPKPEHGEHGRDIAAANPGAEAPIRAPGRTGKFRGWRTPLASPLTLRVRPFSVLTHAVETSRNQEEELDALQDKLGKLYSSIEGE